uniref:SFRICE_004190 n=1 Tax=Spodoptera frugiperda TaxID=7108 RepID=A0A2H1WAI3_SPOFR
MYSCKPTFHHFVLKSHVIGGEPIAIWTGHNSRLREIFENPKKSPVIFCPTRELNPRPLVRQSHLRPLDQRGSKKYNYAYHIVSPSDHHRWGPSNSSDRSSKIDHKHILTPGAADYLAGLPGLRLEKQDSTAESNTVEVPGAHTQYRAYQHITAPPLLIQIQYKYQALIHSTEATDISLMKTNLNKIQIFYRLHC